MAGLSSIDADIAGHRAWSCSGSSVPGSSVSGGSVRNRLINRGDPASVVHHRQERRGRAMVLVRAEGQWRSAEDVMEILNAFDSLDQVVHRQVMPGALQRQQHK